jgi:hypothetical protein
LNFLPPNQKGSTLNSKGLLDSLYRLKEHKRRNRSPKLTVKFTNNTSSLHSNILPTMPHPVFVLVPGASQTPAAYGYLLHLLQSKYGYGAFSALLPSVGATDPVTAADDAEYVRSRMILPVLDIEKHDVILISHSYSSIPASAAASGLGKADRIAQGKTTSVLGQILIAAVVAKGGDGLDLVGNFGGQMPPHIRVDVIFPFLPFLFLASFRFI